MNRIASLVVLSLSGASSFAAVINMSLFSTAYNIPNSQNFQGFTRDRSTGTFYRTNWYLGKQVYSYANASDLQTDSNSTPLSMDDNHLGSYAVVRNGKYFSRSNSVTSATASRFDTTSQTTDLMQTFGGIDPTNGSATFDWGGYSTLNFFDDTTGLYMYGKDLSGNHTMSKMDDNLNVLSSYTFSGATGTDFSFGYAFDIKGHLFLGQDFLGTGIQTRLNLATGLTTPVNFTLAGLFGSTVYISNAFYDDLDDRLYIHTSYGFGKDVEGVYYVDNAAAAFGVVPEPATYLALGGGILVLLRRRRAK